MDANFCPTCAEPLNRLDWSLPQERVSYLSCGAHYFQLSHGDCGCALKQLTLKACTVCGGLIPYLKDWQGVCQACHEKQCKEWRMDAEQSFALLEITPLVSVSRSYYSCKTSITIRPYPNPATFGGMYGTSYAETEEELKAIIADFNKQADGFRENGMIKVEIKRNEPVTVIAQCRLDTSPQVEEEDEEEAQPVQASFI
jgi:hypothetical protein